jgi:site-specific DNA recombinase
MSESNSTTPLRGAAYYRKSDDDDGKSVSEQREWARGASPDQNIDILAEFADDAVAGHDTARRTEFHRMLEFCREQARRKRPIDVVVCYHPNRFSRADSNETGYYVWQFRQAGTGRMFTAARGWVDFSRTEDRMLLNIEQDASNHRFVTDLAQLTTDRRISGALAGRWMGGPVPYAYRPELEQVTKKGVVYLRTRRLVLGPDGEVQIVRRIFHAYAHTAAGLRAIAESLNRDKVPSPRGGKMWGTNTVKRILTSPAYLGRLVWARHRKGKFFGVVKVKGQAKAGTIPDATKGKTVSNDPDTWVWSEKEQDHEPIIDLATWDRCQAKMARRKTAPAPRLGCYALSGLARCGQCGANMITRVNTVRRHGRREGRVDVYRRALCGSYNRSGVSTCAHNAVDADALVEAVRHKLSAGLSHPDFRAALLAEVKRQDAAEVDPARLGALKVKLASLDRKVQKAADLVLDEEDEELLPALRERLRSRQRERDDVAREVADLERAERPGGGANAAAREALALLGRLNEARGDELREVLSETISYVELFFSRQTRGKRTYSTFARGLIHLRPGLLADVLCKFIGAPTSPAGDNVTGQAIDVSAGYGV